MTERPEHEHDWVVRTNDDGDLYEVCGACGKQGHWTPLPSEVLADTGLAQTE